MSPASQSKVASRTAQQLRQLAIEPQRDGSTGRQTGMDENAVLEEVAELERRLEEAKSRLGPGRWRPQTAARISPGMTT